MADYSFITGEYINIDSLKDSSLVIHYNYKTLVRGYKHYELSNHLGNVLVVISDKRITLCSSSVVSSYETDVISASDYYPFGMLMSYRSFSSPVYRYGYNGKEKDDEVKGEGNSIAFEARVFDSRLGKFLSVDPVYNEFPDLTPFAFAACSPIYQIDYLGLAAEVVSTKLPVEQNDQSLLSKLPDKGNKKTKKKDDPEIMFGNGADKKAVSNYSLGVLRKIMKAAGVKKIIITSTARSPAEQARVMYDNIEAVGVAKQKGLYKAPGREVIAAYEKAKKEGKTPEDIKKIMENKINEIGPETVSRHCADLGKLNVIDIAPSSISNKASFIKAVEDAMGTKEVSKFLKPPSDPAYHIEIPQPVVKKKP